MTEIIYLLITTHITIVCVTLYLHRSQAHKAIIFNPIVAHFMRFWLWLTTGMITKEWVAVHRKHHRFCEKQGDPHSPKVYGLFTVLFKGVILYKNAAEDKKMIDSYGVGTPDDWVERNLYSKYTVLGILILLALNIYLFDALGLLIWTIQMIWIPFWAAGVVNGVGHFWGYRNAHTNDNSKNIIPIDFIVGGELLHNNHHIDPKNPKLSKKWFEFDIGWMWLTILRFLRLARIKES